MFLFLQLLCVVYIAYGRTLPNTVDQLIIPSYLGEWYQVYGSPTNTIFQGYGECITAEYGLLQDGDVSVLNTQINENNEVESINGYAYYKNLSEPGKLTVHLNGVPIDSAYWVVKLGEIVDNEYQYSIITSPSGISLWVLTRDVETFFTKYNNEVVEFLKTYNFIYTLINQQNCNYKLSGEPYVDICNDHESEKSCLQYPYKENCVWCYNSLCMSIYNAPHDVIGHLESICKSSFQSSLRGGTKTYKQDKGVKVLMKNHENNIQGLRGYLNNLSDCPEGTSSCEYLPGSYQCCPSNEYCIPNVGCRC